MKKQLWPAVHLCHLVTKDKRQLRYSAACTFVVIAPIFGNTLLAYFVSLLSVISSVLHACAFQ